MATVGEVKQLLAHAMMRGGEGWSSLEAVRVNVGATIEAYKEAAEAVGIVSDGTMDDGINGAVVRYIEAESKARAIMQFIEDAQNASLAAQNQVEQYMGMLG